ncbi:MAG: hypothetical protein KatS3mg026_0735 [Bacteroidia bacterium]|nr:MAG: hypothetical protein KatS3mg026_0735 [Bacteroidia bacterium]
MARRSPCFLVGLAQPLGLLSSLLLAQALPPLWGPEGWRTQAEPLHFYGAQSWARQVDRLYLAHVPLPIPAAPPSALPEVWENYALFDLLRESAPLTLSTYAETQSPSYRSNLARFYAAKYAFLRKAYDQTLEHLARLSPQAFPRLLREEMQFMEGYAAYATGDRLRALTRLKPLTEQLGPFHDAANYYVGLLYYEQGNWKAAATHLETVQTRLPFAREAPLWLAYALAKIPDLPRLASWAEKWALQQPAHADTLWPFVVATLAQGGLCEKAEAFAYLADENPLARLWRGWCAWNEHQDSLALVLWEPLLNRPDSLAAWALYGSAHALYRLRRPEEALAYVRRVPLSPLPPGPGALWMAAQLAWQLRLYETAQEALQAYLALPGAPNRTEARRWLAECLAARAHFAEALAQLDTFPTLSEVRQRLYLLAAFQALKNNAFAEAESLFYQASTLEGPHTGLALFWLAESQYRQQRLESALAGYKRFLQHPQARQTGLEPEARLALAWTLLQTNRPEEALRYSEPLIQKGPADLRPRALFVSAGAYFLKKRYEEALTRYRTLLQELPTAEVRYHLAQTLLRLERYKEAEEVLASLSLSDPGAEKALALRAEICALWTNNPACTRQTAELFLAHFPQSPKAPLVRARLGLALIDLGQKDLAQKTLQSLLENYPTAVEACKLALEGLRTLLPAASYEEVYQAFLRKIPPDSETRLALERDRLRQLAETERWESLKHEARRLRERYPALEGESLFWEGRALLELHDTSAALDLYRRLTQAPEYATQAWETLARLYLAQGRFSEAWACQDSLLRLLPAGGYFRLQGLITWAELASASGKPDTALAVLRNLAADSLLPPLLQQKIQLLSALAAEKAGLPDSALTLLEETIRGQKSALAAEALYHRARILYQKGLYNEARAAIYRLRDEMPNYLEPRARAYLILARIFLAENKRKSARHLLESLVENAPTEALRKEAQALRDAIPPTDPTPRDSTPTPKKPRKTRTPSSKPTKKGG